MVDPSDIFNFNFESHINNFNNIMIILFFYLKFILAGILIMLGTIALLRLKRIYFKRKVLNSNVRKSFFFKNSQFILGNVYIILGIGFLFNFVIYALIIMFDLLPDMLIIPLLKSLSYIPQDFILDYLVNNNLQTPLEIFVYNIIGIISFLVFFSIILNIWFLVANKDHNISKQIISLTIGLIIGCLFSFSRFLPFLL